jgi:hypothetical protein
MRPVFLSSRFPCAAPRFPPTCIAACLLADGMRNGQLTDRDDFRVRAFFQVTFLTRSLCPAAVLTIRPRPLPSSLQADLRRGRFGLAVLLTAALFPSRVISSFAPLFSTLTPTPDRARIRIQAKTSDAGVSPAFRAARVQAGDSPPPASAVIRPLPRPGPWEGVSSQLSERKRS